jgi:hypothetical protein
MWRDWQDTPHPSITPFFGQACNREAGVSMSSCRPSWFRRSTAAQNIALPMTLAGTKRDRR